MQSDKPQVPRVRVIAKDAETEKSVTTTIYNCTPQQVIDYLVRTLKPKPNKTAQ